MAMVFGKLTASAGGRTIRFELWPEQPLTLGRSRTCSVRLRDAMASREHCQLRLVNGRVLVTDLQSTHGLRYRGERCDRFEIDVGDGFHVGETFVRLEGCEPVADAAGHGGAPSQTLTAKAPISRLERGARLGEFAVEQLIGSSDRCDVYQAVHASRGHTVALKVLRGGVGTLADAERRAFLADASAGAVVRDPGLVAVQDRHDADDACFVVLEFVRGVTLAALVARQRLSWRDVVPVLADVLQTLQTLHGRGRVHGGIKPSNVFVLPDGRGMLADPRAVPRPRAAEDPTFFAPEQRNASPVDARADLYSLGCLAYVALAGRVPYAAVAAGVDAADAHPDPLRAQDPSLPAELDDLVCRLLLARDPTARPATAAAAYAALPLTALAAEPGATLRKAAIAETADRPNALVTDPVTDAATEASTDMVLVRPPGVATRGTVRRYRLFVFAIAVVIALLLVAKLVWPG